MSDVNDVPVRRGAKLWRNPDFLKLWAGQTISELGSHISRDGLPLLAVITLGASPAQMGLLSAIGSAPVILIGLVAGVWVDRLRRKPLMILSDVGRALLLLTIPLAAVLGVLRIEQLYLIVALVGMLTVLFNVAYRSYLPSLVERDNIMEGNSKLALSGSTTEVLGPGLTGFLVQTITAPLAILFDALSFLVSAFSLSLIRKSEPEGTAPQAQQSLLREAIEGLQIVIHNPTLRALTGYAATRNFFGSFFGVLYGLYVIRVLNFTPILLGVIVGMGGIGSLLGALLAEPAVRRLGLGVTMITTLVLSAFMALLTPLAASVGPFALAFMLLAQFGDVLHTIYDINEISLRQSITPDRLLGRANASIELLSFGVEPFGALAGGFLGNAIGVQNTFYVAAAGFILGTLWVIVSPVRRMKEMPAAQV